MNSKSVLSSLKPFAPNFVKSMYRRFRKWERFNKRYAFNNGHPFLKDISILGSTFKIMINPYANCCVDDVIATSGVWETEISKNILTYLPPNGVFIDIGANVGYHSLFAAVQHHASTQVFSFEPQQSIYAMVKESIAANNLINTTIFNNGLSDFEGAADLTVFEENKGASSLTKGIKHHSGIATIQKIGIKRLDSYLDVIPKADVIKIDVEGFEFDVLRGGRELLIKYQPVLLIEFSPGLYNLRDKTITAKFIDFLEQLHYSIYTTSGELLNLRMWSVYATEDVSQIDIVCVPRKE